VEKGLAVLLGIMSVAILLAEATLLPSVDLSLFSILIKSVGTQEMLVQVDQFIYTSIHTHSISPCGK
jgi:hypothetical protein